MAPWYASRFVLGTALVLAAAPALADERVVVTLDQAKIMRIAAPAGTIIIGNPSIADATLQDSQTLVITGRGYGSTNLIILDEAGEPVADTQVVVQAPVDTVTVYRSRFRFTYSCPTNCSPALAPGDDETFFSGINSQHALHNETGSGQASSTSDTPAN
jgi:hypothetical protein